LNEYWDSNNKNFWKSALYRVMKHYFGFTKESIVNIEEIYTFLETFRTTYRAHQPIEDSNRNIIENARIELLKYVYTLIRYLPWKINELPLYSRISSNLRVNDSIITFNWDLLLETALSADEAGKILLASTDELLNPMILLSNSYTNYNDAAYKQLHKGYFMKFHGSINYGLCTNVHCWHNSLPYKFSLDEENPSFWVCQAYGSPIEIMIMPPHMHKSYTSNRFYQLQSSIAAKKLSIAQQIIVIGYSFPIYDLDVQTLFRISRLEPNEYKNAYANLEKIIIVNPQVVNSEYLQQINNIFGADLKSSYGDKIEITLYKTVEEYVTKEF
jgi:hypothetical protein